MKIHYGLNDIGEFITILPQLLPILIPVLLVQLVMLTVALISLLKKDLPLNDKIIWIVIIVGVSIIGPVIYFAIGSKMLDNKVANGDEHRR